MARSRHQHRIEECRHALTARITHRPARAPLRLKFTRRSQRSHAISEAKLCPLNNLTRRRMTIDAMNVPKTSLEVSRVIHAPDSTPAGGGRESGLADPAAEGACNCGSHGAITEVPLNVGNALDVTFGRNARPVLQVAIQGNCVRLSGEKIAVLRDDGLVPPSPFMEELGDESSKEAAAIAAAPVPVGIRAAVSHAAGLEASPTSRSQATFPAAVGPAAAGAGLAGDDLDGGRFRARNALKRLAGSM